jgi:predicted nucleic acid-binding protein
VAWAYFDTSALIKRYVDEPGRAEALRLLRTNDCVISAVLPLEVRSALRRRESDGTLRPDDIRNILKRFAADRAFWTAVEVSSDVLAAAETLAASYPLRALDAIHVASARLFAARMPPSRFVFVSADVRQTTVAAALGITTRHVES